VVANLLGPCDARKKDNIDKYNEPFHMCSVGLNESKFSNLISFYW
jgi:hypothetical protein